MHKEKQRYERKAVRQVSVGRPGKSVPAVWLQGPKPLIKAMFSLLVLPSPQLTCYTLNCSCSYSHQPSGGKDPSQCLTPNTSLKFHQTSSVPHIRLDYQLTPRPWGSSIWEELEDSGVGSIKLRMGGGGWVSHSTSYRESSGKNGLSLVPCLQPVYIYPLS